MTDLGLLVWRLALGLSMAFHGYQKVFDELQRRNLIGTLEAEGVPLPSLLAWAAALAELAGGACVALGLLTRLTALLPAFTMAVALLLVHWGRGFSSWELPLLYMAGFIGIAAVGPGRYSLDGMMGRSVST